MGLAAVGAQAQRLLSRVMMIFGVAPAVAPIIGGLLLVVAGWRSIFLFLALLAAALAWASWRYLPETLPPEQRQRLHPRSLVRGYAEIFGSVAFVLLAGAVALNFNGFFLYVLSAPVFVMEHLGLGPTGFGWLFVPTVVGMICGSWLSARLAGRWSQRRTIGLGFGVMLFAVIAGVLYARFMPPGVPGSVIPIGIYTLGMAVSMPSLTLLAFDLFPQRRGMASSCQSFMQVGTNALTAGLFAPLLWATPLMLAAGAGVFLALGVVFFAVWSVCFASHR